MSEPIDWNDEEEMRRSVPERVEMCKHFGPDETYNANGRERWCATCGTRLDMPNTPREVNRGAWVLILAVLVAVAVLFYLFIPAIMHEPVRPSEGSTPPTYGAPRTEAP